MALSVMFVDVQGFQPEPETFVACEIAICPLDEPSKLVHAIFSQQIPYIYLSYAQRKRIDYCRRHIHGLRWSTSSSNRQEFVSKFLADHIPAHSVVYVRGTQKLLFLRRFGPSEATYLELYTPSVRYLAPVGRHCQSHADNSLRCAAECVSQFIIWYKAVESFGCPTPSPIKEEAEKLGQDELD